MLRKWIILNIITLLSISYTFSQKITVVAKKTALKDVLAMISDQSNIYFSYDNSKINDNTKITLIAHNQPLNDVISTICEELGLQYTRIEKQIILKPAPQIEQQQVSTENKPKVIKKYTVSGYVRDSLSKEILINALVAIQGTSTGVFTNEYGFYSLSLPRGEYVLQFSYLGYEKKTVKISLTKSLNLPVNLKMQDHSINVVMVNEETKRDLTRMNKSKSLKISKQYILSTTSAMGNNDAVKSLQSIPGFCLYGEGSVMFNVRGGDKGQNLIIIDDAPVYNPSHLLGFFSAIAPDAVNSMKVYKNSFPSRYENSLSALIDVRTKDGNMQKFGFGGILNPFVSTFSADGPLKKDKISFYTTLRKSNINYLLRKSESNKIDFYDFHFKINFKPSRKNRYYLAFYNGLDYLQVSNSALRWQNKTLTLRWNHLFNDKIFSNTTFYTSLYRYNFFYSVKNNIYWSSAIKNFAIKQDYSYFINTSAKLNFGFNSRVYRFNPGNLTVGSTVISKIFASNVWTNEVYVSGEYSVEKKFTINSGIRFTNWNNYGPTITYLFDSEHNPQDTLFVGKKIFNTYNNFSAHFSATYQFTENIATTFAYDKNLQFLHYLTNTISPFSTLDFWMPSDINLKPEIANQFTLGVYGKSAVFDISVSAFYKKMKNQTDYSNKPDLLLNPLFESQLRFGNIYAEGLEFQLNKPKGKFKYIVTYTYSRTIRKTPEINNFEYYPAIWDKPHNFFTNITYSFSKRFSLAFTFVYISGNRFSAPTSYYYYMNYAVPVYDNKNNAKLPDYHRLDMLITWRLNKNDRNKFHHFLIFSIYNLYGHQNVIAINFNKIQTENGSFVVPQNYVTENEYIPTKTSLLGFFPSITYKFLFR